ncbi:MAG TPA: GAF and ANTAR domain-containing protein [Actinomycetota bacterium]|nr:GAF and ANTAR domain-containing protein [Actinomycetota bacterium]
MNAANPEQELAETFAEIARSLQAQGSVQETLQRIVDLAVDTIDSCEHAGVTLIKAGKFETPAGTDDVPGKVDRVQYQTDEGPCLSAIREHEIYEIGDLSKEERWPKFATRAHDETGVRSMLCFRLFADEDTRGALNMYSKAESAFEDTDRAVGSVFAAHAAVALSTAMEHNQLEEAIRSRDVIGQAKGILMEREGVTADEAYDILRRSSQNLNVKLRDLAAKVAESPAPKAEKRDGSLSTPGK